MTTAFVTSTNSVRPLAAILLDMADGSTASAYEMAHRIGDRAAMDCLDAVMTAENALDGLDVEEVASYGYEVEFTLSLDASSAVVDLALFYSGSLWADAGLATIAARGLATEWPTEVLSWAVVPAAPMFD